jgi:hypothetical protein
MNADLYVSDLSDSHTQPEVRSGRRALFTAGARMRSAGVIKSFAELEARRHFRLRVLMEVKAAVIAHFGGRKRPANKWLYTANPLLDDKPPATAIAEDYLKEHAMDALALAPVESLERTAP